MGYSKRDWIVDEIKRQLAKDGTDIMKPLSPPDSRQPVPYTSADSIQCRLADATGLWPYLCLWDARQYRMQFMEEEGGYYDL